MGRDGRARGQSLRTGTLKKRWKRGFKRKQILVSVQAHTRQELDGLHPASPKKKTLSLRKMEKVYYRSAERAANSPRAKKKGQHFSYFGERRHNGEPADSRRINARERTVPIRDWSRAREKRRPSHRTKKKENRKDAPRREGSHLEKKEERGPSSGASRSPHRW